MAIIALAVALCAKRGLFRFIAGIAGTVFGYIGARYLTGSVAELFCPLVRQPFFKLFSKVNVQQALSELAQKAADGITDIQAGLQNSDLPEKTADIIQGVIEYMGTSVGDIAQMESSGNMAASMADYAAEAVTPVLTFILIFIAIKLLVTVICRLFSADIPVIREINALGGAMLGLVSGVLTVALLCWGVMHFAPSESVGFLSRQTLSESIIGGFFATLFG